MRLAAIVCVLIASSARADAIKYTAPPSSVNNSGASTKALTAPSFTATGGYFKATKVSAPTAGTFGLCTGTLTAATAYYYRVSATNAVGESTAFTEAAKTTGSTGATRGVSVVWTAPTGATGYKVYGRTTGAEQLIATITSATTLSYCDDGSVSPSGALPSANTTGASTIDGSLAVGAATSSGTVTGTTLVATTTGDGTYHAAIAQPTNGRFLLDGPTGSRYINYDGSNINFQGANIIAGSGLTATNGVTCGSGTAITFHACSAATAFDAGSTTLACTCSSNITVANAALGDTASIGLSADMSATNGTYSAVVTGAGTMKACFCTAGTAVDPASVNVTVCATRG